MDSSSQLLMIILALFFVALNGFFVLSEFAIVKVRRSKLEELAKKNKANAKLSLKITKSLDTYLSATQLGITLSSLALGWLGEPAIAKVLYKAFGGFFGDNTILLHSVSFVIAFTIITFLHIVFGELVPKSIAIAKAEQSTLFVAKPLYLFRNVFFPVIKSFEMMSGFFLRRIGIEAVDESENAHSDEEIKIIIGESLKGGYLDSIESEILKNAVDFSDTTAKEIMTPRKDIVCLFAENSYEENIQIVRGTNHTRYPYCKEGKDNVLGMIHIRDLLQATISKDNKRDLSKLVRELIIVPESSSISNVLMKMNKQQIHTALVVDEYGGTAGLLTMEDIIEEIMGDISDEHDTKIDEIKQIDERNFEVDGMLDLDTISEQIRVVFSDDIEQVTIGGYVFNLLGKEPLVGDSVVDGDFAYEILEIDGMRIKKLKITRLRDEEAEEGESKIG